jgi:hypothetical protein
MRNGLPTVSLLSLIPAIPAVLVALLSGCDGPIACDTMLVFSFNLTLVDEAGAPVEGAEVTYSVDSGAFNPCEEVGSGVWACGADEAGSFTVQVSAEGKHFYDLARTIEAGECHVEAVSEELVMKDQICGDAVIPSARVTLAGSGGEALEEQVVDWRHADQGDDAWAPCAPDGSGLFLCGENDAGDLEVRGAAAGHPAVTVPVAVARDMQGCFPVPEDVTITLEWGAD